MHESMIVNYKKDGRLTPVFITLTNEKIQVAQIPRELLKSENKITLAETIKTTCRSPVVLAAVIILEAYGAQVAPNSEIAKQVLNGKIDMSEIKDKKDIIIMIFSSPETEEFIAYYVNDDTKTIGKRFCDDGSNFNGTFSHLFTWNKN